MKNTIELGQFVQSRYKRRWIGVILDVEEREGKTPLITCLVVKTSDGNTPRRRMLKQMDLGWMAKDVKAFDISHINKDWFDLSTSNY